MGTVGHTTTLMGMLGLKATVIETWSTKNGGWMLEDGVGCGRWVIALCVAKHTRSHVAMHLVYRNKWNIPLGRGVCTTTRG